jgi:dTDP-4-dehydrorhamnose reductase
MPRSPTPPGILLLGRNGQIGWELHRTLLTLGPVLALNQSELDLTNHDALRRCVESNRPNLIVNAAAFTSVDKAESDPDRAMAINAHAPAFLAELANKHDALLVHYSTDYVYDGTKDAPYHEADPPNPINVYGRSKLLGDQAIRQSHCRHLILRTSWIYGSRGHNFLLTMRRLAREKPRLRIVADQIGNPTWSRLVAEATAQTLTRLHERSALDIRALYHLSADGSTSWHNFACSIISRMNPPHLSIDHVEPVTSSDYPLPARRPENSRLDNSRIRADLGVLMPHWESSLIQVLDELPPSPS